MVRIRIPIGNEIGEFKINYMSSKTTRDIMNRLPSDQKSQAMFLHHIIVEPRLTLWEWRNEVPLSFIDEIFLCITELFYDYQKKKNQLQEVLDNINSMVLNFFLDEDTKYKKVNKLIKKRDRLLEDLRNFEDEDGIINFSRKDIDKIKKNRNLYI